MRCQRGDKGLRVGERRPMAGQIKLIIPRLKLGEGIHIGRHIAIGRTDNAGRPFHNMVAGEQSTAFLQSEAEMVAGVPRRRHGL